MTTVDIFVCTHQLWLSNDHRPGIEAGMHRVLRIGDTKAMPTGEVPKVGEWAKIASGIKLNELEQWALLGNHNGG